MAQVAVQVQKPADDLTNYRGPGGAGHLQPGQAEVAENQNGVQNDVDNGPGSLTEHGVKGPAGGL